MACNFTHMVNSLSSLTSKRDQGTLKVKNRHSAPSKPLKEDDGTEKKNNKRKASYECSQVAEKASSLRFRRDQDIHCSLAVNGRHSAPSKLQGAERRKKKKRKASSECSQQVAKKKNNAPSQKPDVQVEVELKEEGSETDHRPRSRGRRLSSCVETLLQPQRKNDYADFLAKYDELEKLGEGGYGSVHAGIRKEDQLPVAIKHTDMKNVTFTQVLVNGEVCHFPLEVVLHSKAGGEPASYGKNAAVTLLDWYQTEQELIMVMERPPHCMELFDLLVEKDHLQEHEAKIFMRQLVDAMIEIQSRGVLHRDIKSENLLVEMGSDTPRLRVIDFGCGCKLEEGFYTEFRGTLPFIPPEFYLNDSYKAGPTTVWQLGVLLHYMLTGYYPFNSPMETTFTEPPIPFELSQDCKDFLSSCLDKDPESRPTLECLLHHPWLR